MMIKKLLLTSGMMTTLIFAHAPVASGQSVPFTATIGQSSSCTIVVQRNGRLVPSADASTLSSKLPGGQSGLADVTPFNGRYSVSANHYDVWRNGPEPLSAPNTDFQPSHSGTYRGFQLWGERTTPIRLLARFNRRAVGVELDLVATKTDGSSFATGNYTTEVAVLCE